MYVRTIYNWTNILRIYIAKKIGAKEKLPHDNVHRKPFQYPCPQTRLNVGAYCCLLP